MTLRENTEGKRRSSGLQEILQFFFVYYETIKRELNNRLTYECRCDERLKAKAKRSTRLAYTGLRRGELAMFLVALTKSLIYYLSKMLFSIFF